MKKIITALIIVLIIILAFVIIFAFNLSNKKHETIITDFTSVISDNSSWNTLTKKDFNSLILKSYSDNILTIINSLENAIPVIIKVSEGNLSEDGKYNFVVASAFSSPDDVYVYINIDGTYKKVSISLEELLEDAVSFFALKDTEVLK